MKSRHGRAVALMLGGVVFFSTNGLFVELTFGENHPFLYNTGVWVGTTLGLGLLTFLLHRPVFSDPVSRRVLFRRSVGLRTDGVRRWDLVVLLWLLVVGRFAFAFFGWAIHYVDTATVSVLHYTWPVLFVLVLARWDRTNRGRYRRVTGFSWAGLGLAFIGMAAVVVGTVGVEARGTVLEEGVLGIVLTVISAFLQAGVATLGFPFAYGVASEIARKTEASLKWDSLEFGCLLFVYCLSGAIAVVPNAVIGWLTGGIITSDSFGWAVAVGVSFVPGAALARKAVLITPDLGINALVYASPVVGLLWLGLFTQITVARLDLLVVGAITVAAANVLLNRPGGHAARASNG